MLDVGHNYFLKKDWASGPLTRVPSLHPCHICLLSSISKHNENPKSMGNLHQAHSHGLILYCLRHMEKCTMGLKLFKVSTRMISLSFQVIKHVWTFASLKASRVFWTNESMSIGNLLWPGLNVHVQDNMRFYGNPNLSIFSRKMSIIEFSINSLEF